jgi:hypothetical protein
MYEPHVLASQDNSNGCSGHTENLNVQVMGMTLLAHKGIKLTIPIQVSNNYFNEIRLGAGERQYPLAVCNAPQIANPHSIVCLHRAAEYKVIRSLM